MLMGARGVGALIGPLISGRWAGDSHSRLRAGILIGFLTAAAGYVCLGSPRRSPSPSSPWWLRTPGVPPTGSSRGRCFRSTRKIVFADASSARISASACSASPPAVIWPASRSISAFPPARFRRRDRRGDARARRRLGRRAPSHPAPLNQAACAVAHHQRSPRAPARSDYNSGNATFLRRHMSCRCRIRAEFNTGHHIRYPRCDRRRRARCHPS